MGRLPKGLFRRKNRSGYYTRVYKDGRERMVCLGRDPNAAARKLRELRARKDALPSRLPVSEAIAQWLSSYIAIHRNAKGLKLATARAKSYLAPFFGLKRVGAVRTDDVRGYRLWLEGRKLSAQSVKHILSDARAFFRWCEDAGLLDRAPIPHRLMPRIEERPPDRLTDDEAAAVTKVAEPYGFVCRLALGTGLRWSELARARSIDVQSGALLVPKSKSGKVRRVPVPAWLMSELRGRVGRLVPFGSDSGDFNARVRELSGVQRFHAHQLRHTFACRWLEAGGSLAALQEALGHSTIVVTQRYARISHDMLMREAARISGANPSQDPSHEAS